MYGIVSVDRAPGLWGGYAQYQYLAPDSMLCRVPATLDAVTATLFNPLGAGIRWAVTVPGTRAGDVVAVLGPGVRGLSAGGLADVVVDVTAKAPAAFAQAIDLARPGGTVVVAGTRGRRAAGSAFDPDRIVYKELRVLGALGVDAVAYNEALELLAARRFPFETLPRRVAGLDDVGGLLSVMAGEGEVPPVHAVVVPEASG